MQKRVRNELEVSKQVEFIKPELLKPDKNQPRKSFSDEAVENMAKTILTQGVINPIEVDEKNVIITGEIRWRGAKQAKVPVVSCRRITGITTDERLERQAIENLHRSDLTWIEREDMIYSLYKSGRYGKPERKEGKPGPDGGTISKMAKVLPYTHKTIGDIIESKEARVILDVPSSITTTVIAETAVLPDADRKKVIEFVSKKGVTQQPSQTNLRELVQVVKKATESVKQAVLTKDSGVTPEVARKILEMPKEEHAGVVKVIEKAKLSEDESKRRIEVLQSKEVVQEVKAELLNPKGRIDANDAIQISVLKPEDQKGVIEEIQRGKSQKESIRSIVETVKRIDEEGGTKPIIAIRDPAGQYIENLRAGCETIKTLGIETISSMTPRQKEGIRELIDDLIQYLTKMRGATE